MTHSARQFETKPVGGPFGISAELPTLRDVVDYEEGRIVMTHGYPRFVAHRTVAQKERLARVATGMPYAAAFPSLRQAHFILNDCIQRFFPRRGFFAIEVNALLFMNSMHPGKKSSRVVGDPSTLILVEVDGLTVACLQRKKDYERLVNLRRTWGSGFDVHALAGETVPKSGNVTAELKVALTNLEGPRAAGCALYQSGMAAISSVMVLAMYLKRRVICIGSTYVDTGVIVERWPKEVMSFYCTRLPDDFTEEMLDAELAKGPSLIFFEAPSNPHLRLLDYERISEKAHSKDAFLVADATVATPYNFKPLELGFDLVIHSTSKFLSGKLNHLGGVAISSSKEILAILEEIAVAVDLRMCENQAAVLLENLSSFDERMKRINASAAEIAKRLSRHPKVAKVFYPGAESPEQKALSDKYLSVGRGGLLAFLLADETPEGLAEFYDTVSRPVLKGPGFGGETSLLCPYVMLAHYRDDPAFLERLGLDLHLLRLSVGTEPVDEIWNGLHLDE